MHLFLANYPIAENIREGMSQRMVAIDRQFDKVDRAYLFVSYRFFRKKQVVKISESVTQYRCNMLIHFFFILRLMRSADTLFFHSVINVLPVLPFLVLIPNQTRWILDVHGVVPEEMKLAGLKMKSFLYGFSERFIFRRLDVAIVVSRTMENHLRQKYPNSTSRYVTYFIVPVHIGKLPEIKEVMQVKSSKLVVVYSGNTQRWQHIDLMLEIIKRNRASHVCYYLLTGEPERMNKLLAAHGMIPDENLNVKSVTPESLHEYYQIAHFGFVLRDDIVVNQVACPTKLVEYLYYGMTPIVKSRSIGDFESLGYECVNYRDFSIDALPQKCSVNCRIVRTMLAENENMNLLTLLAKNA